MMLPALHPRSTPVGPPSSLRHSPVIVAAAPTGNTNPVRRTATGGAKPGAAFKAAENNKPTPLHAQRALRRRQSRGAVQKGSMVQATAQIPTVPAVLDVPRPKFCGVATERLNLLIPTDISVASLESPLNAAATLRVSTLPRVAAATSASTLATASSASELPHIVFKSAGAAAEMLSFDQFAVRVRSGSSTPVIPYTPRPRSREERNSPSPKGMLVLAALAKENAAVNNYARRPSSMQLEPLPTKAMGMSVANASVGPTLTEDLISVGGGTASATAEGSSAACSFSLKIAVAARAEPSCTSTAAATGGATATAAGEETAVAMETTAGAAAATSPTMRLLHETAAKLTAAERLERLEKRLRAVRKRSARKRDAERSEAAAILKATMGTKRRVSATSARAAKASALAAKNRGEYTGVAFVKPGLIWKPGRAPTYDTKGGV